MQPLLKTPIITLLISLAQLSPCAATPAPITYYLKPSTTTATPATFWCIGTNNVQSVCGTGGCTSGCQNIGASADNLTTTTYKAFTSTGGSTGAQILTYCFSQPVLPQKFYADVSNSYHSRVSWTARTSASNTGATTVAQTFSNSPFVNPFTFKFNPPVTTPAYCWSMLTNNEVGQLYINEAYWSAVFCPFGYYLSATLTCNACPSGTYGNKYGTGTSQSSFCLSCPAGKFSTAGNTVCTLCPAGSFSSIASVSLCQSCAPGTYSSSLGLSTSTPCTLCGAGKYSSSSFEVTVSNCNTCTSGTYSSALGLTSAILCIQCAAGTYSSAVSATAVAICQSCSAGTYASGAAFTASVMCSLCGFGTYSSALSGSTPSACLNCQVGGYSTGSGITTSSICTLCPLGSYAPTTPASTCKICSVGSFTNTTGASSCRLCSAGTFSNATGLSLCYACASSGCVCSPGTYGNTASCTICPAGTYASNFGATACTNCTVCRATQLTLTSCDQGSTYNATACTCAAGTYGTSVCTQCPAGKYSGSNGATACTNCSVCGAYQTVIATCRQGSAYDATACTCIPGSYGTPTACTQCAVGTYSSNNGTLSCTPCSDCDPSQISLVTCAAGSTADTTQCTCPSGTYGPQGYGPAPCTVCAGCAPDYTDQNPCGVGQSADTTQCSYICPAGTYATLATVPDLSGCISCDPGSYSSAIGSVMCAQCEAGKYSPDMDSTVCIQCEGGTHSFNNGSTTCAAASCVICTPDQVCLNGIASTCPANSLAPPGSDNNDDCVCKPGFYGPNGGPCVQCLVNTFCPGGNVTTRCTANAVAPVQSTNATACYCDRGYQGVANAACVACPPDTWCWTGVLNSCPNHTTSNALSNWWLNCTCLPGYTGPDGTACAPCAAGTYKQSKGSAACTACPANSYCDLGYINPIACPLANSNSPTGSIAVQQCQCNAGYYGALCSACPVTAYCPGGSLAYNCPNNGYTPAIAAAAASQCVCPANSTVNGSGICECVGGYQHIMDNKTAAGWRCNVCAANAYCAGGVAYPCPTGSVTSAPGATNLLACLCTAPAYLNVPYDGSSTGCLANPMSSMGFYQGCDTYVLTDDQNSRVWTVGISNGVFGSRVLLAGGGSGPIDGTGASARFANPSSVAVSPDGSFALVTDYTTCVLRKVFISNLTVVTVAGLSSACSSAVDGVGSDARFTHILSTAYIPSSGSLYIIGEEGSKTVRIYNDTSKSVTTIATMSNAVSGTAATQTTAYVSGAGAPTVWAIDLKTYTVTTWLTGLAGPVYGKVGLSSDYTRAVIPLMSGPEKLQIVDLATKATIITVTDSAGAFGGLGYETSPVYSPDNAYIYIWTHASCMTVIDTVNYGITKTCPGTSGYGMMAYVPPAACPSKTATPFCASCPASKYCPPMKTNCPNCTCTGCTANEYYISNTQCGTCPANSTSLIGTPYIGGCTCIDGTYAMNNNTASQQCSACPPGFYCKGGFSTPCPLNSYCAGNTITPVACPALSTASLYSNSSGACLCGDGYYMSNGVCVMCGYGTYGAKGTVGACKVCPGNSNTTAPGSNLSGQCVCNPGYSGDCSNTLWNNNSNCDSCSANSYCPGGKPNNTIPCPNSTYSSPGALSVDQCTCPTNSTWLPGLNCTCNNGSYAGQPPPPLCSNRIICGDGKQCAYSVVAGSENPSYPLSDSFTNVTCTGLITYIPSWGAVIDLGQSYTNLYIDFMYGQYWGGNGGTCSKCCTDRTDGIVISVGSSPTNTIPCYTAPTNLGSLNPTLFTFVNVTSCNSATGRYVKIFYDNGQTLSLGKLVIKTPHCPVSQSQNVGWQCNSCAAGNYCQLGNTTACPAQFYCPASASAPTACPSGSYCPASASAPVLCPPGRYCQNGTAIPCPAGSFCVAGASAPTACPPSTLCTPPAASAVQCPGGSWCLNGSATQCPPGSFCAPGVSIPVICPMASFCPASVPGPTPCTANSNTASQGSTAAAQCVCNQGYYGTSAGCTWCPANSYCGGGQQRVTCPQGLYSVPGTSDPALCMCPSDAAWVDGLCVCQPGRQRIANPANPLAGWECHPCPANNVCVNGTASVCAEGAFCVGGLSSQCQADTYCPKGVSAPIPCQPLSSSVAGSAVCTCYDSFVFINNTCPLCPADSYCVTGIQTKCPAGATSNAGSVVASACYCSASTYLPAGAAACVPCDAGSYCVGGSITSVIAILPCPAGTFCPQGASTPTTCSTTLGALCLAGASALAMCPAGFVCADTIGPAKACPVGAYCRTGSTAPTSCPAETFSTSRLQTNVSACGPCTFCPTGMVIMTDCTPSADRTCTPCQGAPLQAAYISKECDWRCKDGYSGPNCTSCQPGFWCATGISNKCPLHSTSLTGAKSQNDCTCNPGYMSEGALLATGPCAQCTAGSICPGGTVIQVVIQSTPKINVDTQVMLVQQPIPPADSLVTLLSAIPDSLAAMQVTVPAGVSVFTRQVCRGTYCIACDGSAACVQMIWVGISLGISGKYAFNVSSVPADALITFVPPPSKTMVLCLPTIALPAEYQTGLVAVVSSISTIATIPITCPTNSLMANSLPVTGTATPLPPSTPALRRRLLAVERQHNRQLRTLGTQTTPTSDAVAFSLVVATAIINQTQASVASANLTVQGYTSVTPPPRQITVYNSTNTTTVPTATSCPINATSPPGAVSLTQCVCLPGYKGDAASGAPCAPCEPGVFCSGGLIGLCPGNATAPPMSNSSEACACNPGFSGTNDCAQCPANSFCTGGKAIAACVANATSPAQSGSSAACYCAPGYEGVQNRQCKPCSPGAWCWTGISNPCPANKTSSSRARRVSDCICADGYQSTATKDANGGSITVCTICAQDVYCKVSPPPPSHPQKRRV